MTAVRAVRAQRPDVWWRCQTAVVGITTVVPVISPYLGSATGVAMNVAHTDDVMLPILPVMVEIPAWRIHAPETIVAVTHKREYILAGDQGAPIHSGGTGVSDVNITDDRFGQISDCSLTLLVNMPAGCAHLDAVEVTS